MSYAKLGNTCCQDSTIALTSNQKFIPPLDPIYFKKYTNMLKFPSSDNVYTDGLGAIDPENPENIKSYFTKNTSPASMACNSCSSINY